MAAAAAIFLFLIFYYQKMAAAAAEGYDPYRDYIYGEGEKDTVWRDGEVPNYDDVNKLFEEGRTNVWPVGSLEEKVQRLVKSWEMELVHKVRPQDIKTTNYEKFRFQLHGGEEITAAQIGERGGSYNVFLATTLPPEIRIFDPDQEPAAQSQDTFKKSFPRGFALEILEVLRGPPKIVYKFRHWGYFEKNPFKGHCPTNAKLEFHGMSVFELDQDGKIVKVEFYYERSELLGGFLKGAYGSSACPVLKNN